jgi:hypothetical protein
VKGENATFPAQAGRVIAPTEFRLAYAYAAKGPAVLRLCPSKEGFDFFGFAALQSAFVPIKQRGSPMAWQSVFNLGNFDVCLHFFVLSYVVY